MFFAVSADQSEEVLKRVFRDDDPNSLLSDFKYLHIERTKCPVVDSSDADRTYDNSSNSSENIECPLSSFLLFYS
jgi:hypothetical protein